MAADLVSGPAVLDHDPAPNEWGMVARIVGPITFTVGQPTSCTVTHINTSIIAVPFLPANPNRKGALIYNYSNKGLYIRLGPVPATLVLFTAKLFINDAYELPFPAFTGPISGIWDGVDAGFATVTELT